MIPLPLPSILTTIRGILYRKAGSDLSPFVPTIFIDAIFLLFLLSLSLSVCKFLFEVAGKQNENLQYTVLVFSWLEVSRTRCVYVVVQRRCNTYVVIAFVVVVVYERDFLFQSSESGVRVHTFRVPLLQIFFHSSF